MTALEQRARLAWWVTIASYLGLLAALSLATLVWPSDGREPNAVIWALLAIPLLILLPGLWRGGLRTNAWAAFLSLLYFTIAVPNVFKAGVRLLDWIEMICAVLLFLASTLYIRWAARAGRERTVIDNQATGEQA
ncbi:MAG: DUF2069 domain-containing protein [Spongiibacteraceae bacterium]|jgi:uncharacterized membrane protein|nr:DUF2069 domain-containing protein [Spongiibacteraceae bacterium]